MYYLLIKTHNKTGLKYLCKHEGTKESALKYKGSGKRWKPHLMKHGFDISTTILVETDSLEELSQKGVEYSEQWDVAKNKTWANLIWETGFPIGGINHPTFGKHWMLSQETKRKIGLAKLGVKNPQFGKQTSKNQKEKTAQIKYWQGKQRSKETKNKIAQKMKIFWARRKQDD